MTRKPSTKTPPQAEKELATAAQPPAPEGAGQKPIAGSTASESDCPVLRALLRDLGLPFLPRYTKSELVPVLGAEGRTLQEWMRDGRLPSRKLPNNVRCLPADVEEFLANSRRDPAALDEPGKESEGMTS